MTVAPHHGSNVLALLDARWEDQPAVVAAGEVGSAPQDPSLLVVKRTGADGTIRTVTLTDDGGRPRLWVTPPDGSTAGGETVGAEEAASLLSVVAPGELTEFTLGGAGVTPEMLASRLLVTEPENLDADESWYEDWDELLCYSQLDGVGSRLVVIDGVQWYAVEVQGREAQPLLIASEEGGNVQMAVWGMATYSETASMISGTDWWWMGRAWDPDVVVEVDMEDEGTPYVACRYSPGAQKIPAIIQWLPTGHPGGWDPPEQVLPTGSGSAWSEFGAVCFGSDSAVRDGSPTGDWGLYLDLDPDEIEQFNAAGRSGTPPEHG